MSTIHDPRYRQLIERLREAREKKGIRQETLANKLGRPQSYVSKIESLERRLDIIELFDWLDGLGYQPQQFFRDIGWFSADMRASYLPFEQKIKEPESGWFPYGRGVAPLPIEGEVKEHEMGVLQQLLWEGQIKEVLLEGITREQYLRVEQAVSETFRSLNVSNPIIDLLRDKA